MSIAGEIMSKFVHTVLIGMLSMTALVPLAQARNLVVRFPVADAMGTSEAKEKLNAGVKFLFGKQTKVQTGMSLGTFTSSKKTNGFKKDPKTACAHAFLSAMIEFQKRAVSLGGDTVLLTSNYAYKSLDSNDEFECGTGALMVGVAFQGEIFKAK
jgi:hypothetical protein